MVAQAGLQNDVGTVISHFGGGVLGESIVTIIPHMIITLLSWRPGWIPSCWKQDKGSTQLSWMDVIITPSHNACHHQSRGLQKLLVAALPQATNYNTMTSRWPGNIRYPGNGRLYLGRQHTLTHCNPWPAVDLCECHNQVSLYGRSAMTWDQQLGYSHYFLQFGLHHDNTIWKDVRWESKRQADCNGLACRRHQYMQMLVRIGSR